MRLSCGSISWYGTCSRSSLRTWAPRPALAGTRRLPGSTRSSWRWRRPWPSSGSSISRCAPYPASSRASCSWSGSSACLRCTARTWRTCAGQAILDGLGADEKDQLRPRILFSDVIEDVTDAHAVIINRNRAGSMIIPGDTLGVSEVTPALFAAVAANEAERAAPGVTLVDVSMIGAAGRIYLAGPVADVRLAQAEITEVLSAVTGREQ